jgi:predicted nucleic acid-binding protein
MPCSRNLIQAKLVRPFHKVAMSPDEPENRFLECAETIDAEFLITGNKRHFPGIWKGTKIVNAREFLERVVPL